MISFTDLKAFCLKRDYIYPAYPGEHVFQGRRFQLKIRNGAIRLELPTRHYAVLLLLKGSEAEDGLPSLRDAGV